MRCAQWRARNCSVDTVDGDADMMIKAWLGREDKNTENTEFRWRSCGRTMDWEFTKVFGDVGKRVVTRRDRHVMNSCLRHVKRLKR